MSSRARHKQAYLALQWIWAARKSRFRELFIQIIQESSYNKSKISISKFFVVLFTDSWQNFSQFILEYKPNRAKYQKNANHRTNRDASYLCFKKINMIGDLATELDSHETRLKNQPELYALLTTLLGR